MLSRYSRQENTSRRLQVGLVGREERVHLALGLIDRLRLVRFRLLHDVVGLAARARQDVVAVGLGLVAGAHLIGAGALHVVERVDHRRRRIDPLQLHLDHLDAGAVGIQQSLQLLARLVRDLLAPVGQRRRIGLRPITSRTAVFGRHARDVLRVLHPEQERARVLDLPELTE